MVRRPGVAGIAEGRRQLEAVRAGLDRVVGRAIDETANWGAAARGVNNFVTGLDGGEVIRQEDLVTYDVVPAPVEPRRLVQPHTGRVRRHEALARAIKHAA